MKLKKIYFYIFILCIFSASASAKDFSNQYIKLTSVTHNTASIAKGNLKIGQSGIIIHKYKNTKLESILANARVIKSSRKITYLKLSPFNDLNQNALPKSKLKPQKGDIFILNYLYHNALLIAPNEDSIKVARAKFSKFNFIQGDIFAAYLKFHSEPFAKEATFKTFAKSHNLGTIFFIIGNYAYMLDAKTFKILQKTYLFHQEKKQSLPFYTRITDIESNFWNVSFSKGYKKSYDSYYKHIIGIN